MAYKFIDAVLWYRNLGGAEEIEFGPPQDVCKSGTCKYASASRAPISTATAPSTFACVEIKRRWRGARKFDPHRSPRSRATRRT